MVHPDEVTSSSNVEEAVATILAAAVIVAAVVAFVMLGIALNAVLGPLSDVYR